MLETSAPSRTPIFRTAFSIQCMASVSLSSQKSMALVSRSLYFRGKLGLPMIPALGSSFLMCAATSAQAAASCSQRKVMHSWRTGSCTGQARRVYSLHGRQRGMTMSSWTRRPVRR